MVMRLAITVVLILTCCAGAPATQDLNSASGYVLVPDASVAPAGQWQFSGAYVAPRGTNELSNLTEIFVCDGSGFDLRALYGVCKRTEAGIGYLNVNKDAGHASTFTFAAKTSLMDDPKCGMALSAGFMYRPWSTNMSVVANPFTLKAALPTVWSVYVVLGKKWAAEKNTWAASVGLAYDNYSSTSQDTGGLPVTPFGPVQVDGRIDSNGSVRPFLGASMTTGEWIFMADYKPSTESGGFKYQDTFWSVAARKAINKDVTATAGITTFNIPYTKSDLGFFLDLTYMK